MITKLISGLQDAYSLNSLLKKCYLKVNFLFKIEDNQYAQLDRIFEICGDYAKNGVPNDVIKQFR